MARHQLTLPIMVVLCINAAAARPATACSGSPDQQSISQFIETHCLACHDSDTNTAGLALDAILFEDIERHPAVWETVVRRLSARQMPPADMPRPDEQETEHVLRQLTERLDAEAARDPFPGRTDSLRRMTRTEYRNAIRDLLALDVDVIDLLPADESSHGFDNITVTGLSPVLLNRYVTAAQKISRQAVGSIGRTPGGETIRVRPDITQDRNHVPGLPPGTRGGIVIPYHFPQDGEYRIQVSLMRNRNDELEGLRGSHELEILLDRERKASFTISPPKGGKGDREVDADLTAYIEVTAGQHDVGVTFVAEPFSLLESDRQPLNVHYNFYRHPRLGPAVYQVSITGPYSATGPGDTASRRKIFTCRPETPEDEAACAEQILSRLMRLAYRRPVTADDLQTPMTLYREARAEHDNFDAGIENALAAILVSPHFLFRIERDSDPVSGEAIAAVAADPAASDVRDISDLELASRLSFFIWSSIPDDELLTAAERGELSDPAVLEHQVRRMLADERSGSLVTNFADQWLYLRNLEAVTPDGRKFPDFGHNLRDAFRQETQLLFEDVLRNDRSVLALIDSPFTYLNERLARHYGIPHVQGTRFRKVELTEDIPRGGILRHGSILSVTSYATRTSPVIRGKWILENLLGTPPPPPPADVPALEDNTVSAQLPVRERLAAHRANAACAVCHNLIDPVGFGLENYDAVGRWREQEVGQPVDATGALPDGTTFHGVRGLEQALLARPETFVRTLTEKLMTYGLGRGVEHYDAPAVRRILREAESQNYRFSALILGIAQSVPFRMRATDTGRQTD